VPQSQLSSPEGDDGSCCKGDELGFQDLHYISAALWKSSVEMDEASGSEEDYSRLPTDCAALQHRQNHESLHALRLMAIHESEPHHRSGSYQVS